MVIFGMMYQPQNDTGQKPPGKQGYCHSDQESGQITDLPIRASTLCELEPVSLINSENQLIGHQIG